MMRVLRRQASTYGALAAMEAKLYLAYNYYVVVDYVIQILSMIIYVYFWRAIYKGADTLGGLTLAQTINYILLARILASLLETRTIFRFGFLLRSGDFALELVRPVDFLARQYVEHFTGVLIFFVQRIPPLIAAAKELGGEPAKALPWGSFRECIEKAYGGPGGEMEKALQRGGLFGESPPARSSPRASAVALPKPAERPVGGDPKAFPLALHLYPSIAFYDGRGANLPWLQEMPDAISTAVWRNWVEVNPKTAEGLGLAEGDGVTVTSPAGKITAHVAFNPGIAPDVAAMPLGQGHTRYGKYANGRGENPITLLPAGETFALQGTRVVLAKTKLSTALARTAHPEGQWKISNLM